MAIGQENASLGIIDEILVVVNKILMEGFFAFSFPSSRVELIAISSCACEAMMAFHLQENRLRTPDFQP